ncbi:MAG: hypothetical protein J2P17_33900 [Mycobacterium sp.]|nr:hypothetical protein [Mycobacterium sp.]
MSKDYNHATGDPLSRHGDQPTTTQLQESVHETRRPPQQSGARITIRRLSKFDTSGVAFNSHATG